MRPRSRLLEASRGYRLLCGIASLSLALLVGGCGLYGDFDRVRPSLATDEANARIDREELIRDGGKPSNFSLTDEERQLRDLARAIIPPPNNPNRWDTVFRDYVLDDIEWLGTAKDKREVVKFDRTAYLRDLHQDERRSEASAYAKLITDAREDVIRLEPFFAIASRVADVDRKRELCTCAGVDLQHGRAQQCAQTQPGERRYRDASSAVRLASAWSATIMRSSALSSQAPSPMAADSERALTLLHTRIGQYCRSGQQITAKG